ncbi:MAG: leucine-rich repeat domain-containing protein [Promethearchaeota archaeon]|jgi:Leucine-rich repeat (LRR) protein
MSSNPKKIYEDLERKKIDKLTAVDLLIYLISNNDSIEIREESIKFLKEIGIKNDKVFSVFEDILVSDPNLEIRELGVQCLKELFQEKALIPLKWALDHEKSWQLLLYIVSSIKDINNHSVKSIFIDKIKRLNNYKFIKSLTGLIKNKEIQNIDLSKLVDIIKNYIIINYIEETLKDVKYSVIDGLIVDLDLAFTSDDVYGWKILKYLSEFISVMGNLNKLELNSNKLGKIPDSIFTLNTITYLDLSYNNLNELQDLFKNMQSLEYLNLGYNQVFEIPQSIGLLKNLKLLDLNHNKLKSLPSSIGKLSSLVNLNLHGNQITSLPQSLKELKTLEVLNVGLNQLSNVPKWLGNLKSLKKLSLGGNKSLFKVEEWVDFLPSIIELNLYDNNIELLPDSFGTLDSLKILIIPNNQISTLPSSFQKLNSLKKLDLSWNTIQDLPDWIDSFKSLEELNLRGNNLSQLPKSIYSLPSLRVLNISLNKNIIYPPKDLEKKNLQIIY